MVGATFPVLLWFLAYHLLSLDSSKLQSPRLCLSLTLMELMWVQCLLPDPSSHYLLPFTLFMDQLDAKNTPYLETASHNCVSITLPAQLSHRLSTTLKLPLVTIWSGRALYPLFGASAMTAPPLPRPGHSIGSKTQVSLACPSRNVAQHLVH